MPWEWHATLLGKPLVLSLARALQLSLPLLPYIIVCIHILIKYEVKMPREYQKKAGWSHDLANRNGDLDAADFFRWPLTLREKFFRWILILRVNWNGLHGKEPSDLHTDGSLRCLEKHREGLELSFFLLFFAKHNAQIFCSRHQIILTFNYCWIKDWFMLSIIVIFMFQQLKNSCVASKSARRIRFFASAKVFIDLFFKIPRLSQLTPVRGWKTVFDRSVRACRKSPHLARWLATANFLKKKGHALVKRCCQCMTWKL